MGSKVVALKTFNLFKLRKEFAILWKLFMERNVYRIAFWKHSQETALQEVKNDCHLISHP